MGHGAMMSYLAARKLPELKAVVIWAGQSDLARALTFRPAMENVYQARIPLYAENKKQVLKQRSAIHCVNELNPEMAMMSAIQSNPIFTI